VADRELPITEHLAELRGRIFWVLLTWFICAAASFAWAEQIFEVLLAPATGALGIDGKLQSIAPAEIFFTYVKSALLSGFVFALPVIFWQVWGFVAPGLYASEKRHVVPFVFFSTLLFGGGAFFGYTIVFPIIFDFFNSFSSDFVVSAWTMAEVFSLTTRLFLAFGVAFELPLLVFFLALAGLVTARQLFAFTPHAVLIAFVLSAMLTPPDVVSQVFLAGPMVILYLLGVGAAYVVGKLRSRAAAKEEVEGEIQA